MQTVRRIVIVALTAVAAVLFYQFITGPGVLRAAAAQSFVGLDEAPEFPPELDWINTGGRKFSLEALRGKVVLLDFWTYGCINCLHVIPDLERLEEKYADELVVIGVHTAKFENEGKLEQLKKIVARYELKHPVVNDKDYQVWRAYGARAWPTLALIAPDGGLVGSVAGEGHYNLLDSVIGGIIEEFEPLDVLNREPVELTLEADLMADTFLRFPGKVLADEESGRLFVADSNNNRIVIATLNGQITDIVGDGEIGLRDGGYAEARFYRPQGMSLDGDKLYVADTENHALRLVDLAKKTVTTLVGNGVQQYLRAPSYAADDASMNSPWDVLAYDDKVYIAMAGQHQIWAYDHAKGRIEEFAGSRREELADGPRLKGGLNQPSGLATDGEVLYIADSEASAIRTAGLAKDGKLDTIVGTGLFDFGDIDGRGRTVRLQHPLGVVYHDEQLFVADTYNSKIKRIDPATRESKTFAGGAGEFDEPGGLSLAGGKLFVADTNHHAIKTVDLASGEVDELVLFQPKP